MAGLLIPPFRHFGKYFFGILALFFSAIWFFQNLQNIPIDTDCPIHDLPWRPGLTQIDAGIHRFRVLPRHPPEWILNDDGGICADSKFQIQDMPSFVALHKILIPPGRFVPSIVLHKSPVTSKIHGHRCAADRTAGDQPGRDPHISLLRKHLPDSCLIVICFLMTGAGTLPQAVISLGIEQPIPVKSGFLELMVHIGSQYKIVLILHQIQQSFIYICRSRLIPVQVNIPAPERPVFLQSVIRIKPSGIHIVKSVLFLKVRKMLLEPLS